VADKPNEQGAYPDFRIPPLVATKEMRLVSRALADYPEPKTCASIYDDAPGSSLNLVVRSEIIIFFCG
jgi:hypothetical protein